MIESPSVQHSLMSAVFEQAPEAMAIHDDHGHLVAVNNSYRQMLRAAPDADVTVQLEHLNGNITRRFLVQLRSILRMDGRWSGEGLLRRPGLPSLPVALVVSRVTWLFSTQPFYLSILTDISSRKREEERFQRMAHYDPLTGLPNRALMRDRLRVALASAQRSRRPGALMFLDLDRFKWVNDTLGHDAGDTLLCETARRLLRCVRDSDTVARQGGDEFIIILSGLTQGEDAEIVAKNILVALAKPYLLSGNSEIYISGSIGITLFPADGKKSEDLLQNADIAMYRSKESGKNTYRFYTPAMNEQAMIRMQWETDLHHALDNNEFELFFQPILSLDHRVVVGGEALLRWNRPGHGLLAPASFLESAEDTGVIIPIGHWVLDQAVKTLLRWRSIGLGDVRLSINLSLRQLRNATHIEEARDRLSANGIDPAMLEFEISEDILKTENFYSQESLQRIISFGVSLSLDDFGQGYLSLRHLRRYPIRSLKIDHLFIRNVTLEEEDASFTRAMIAMAHSLGITIIAEGVEQQDQCDFLEQNGCDFVQGYLFSHPLREKDFLTFVRSHRPLSAAESGARPSLADQPAAGQHRPDGSAQIGQDADQQRMT